jgi:hypothetical protein
MATAVVVLQGKSTNSNRGSVEVKQGSNQWGLRPVSFYVSLMTKMVIVNRILTYKRLSYKYVMLEQTLDSLLECLCLGCIHTYM